MGQKESKTSTNEWMDAWHMNEECESEAGHVTSLSIPFSSLSSPKPFDNIRQQIP